MTHFIAYPVTPEMGLRQSINAMLAHVAYNGRDFGYLPDAVQYSNYRCLLEDYSTILRASGDYLTLSARIDDSALLADLADTLVTLCNDYPAYDDEDVSSIEYERLIEMIDECKNEHDAEDIESHDIARELWDIGAEIEQSEYGADVPEDDFRLAIANLLARSAAI